MISWSPTLRSSTVTEVSPSVSSSSPVASVLLVVASTIVTVPSVTGSSPPVTLAVNVTSSPANDGFAEAVSVVTVEGSSVEATVRHQPPSIEPVSVLASSTTNRRQSPLGFVR